MLNAGLRPRLCLAGSSLLLALTACSAPTATAFSIAASPSVTVSAGKTAVMTVTATTSSSRAQTATLIIYNLPKGVSYSPASPTVTTGEQTIVTLTAAPNAPLSTAQVQIVGAVGLVGSSVNVPITVSPAQ